MRRVNAELIRTKAAAIRRTVERIRRLTSIPDEQFWGDERNIETIKLWLIELVQDAANLCNHLAARLAHQVPLSYPECFEVLGNEGILDKPLADSLHTMARFRNLLVYRYWDGDDQRVLEIARTQLDDLERFLEAIGRVTGVAYDGV